jgi:hypothetical protein
MSLPGKGMLITWMDVDPAEEQDFNLWYDREHLAERVAIDGFLEARRWRAHQAPTKYFCTYTTETFEVLDSPAYRAVLANQTEWSKKHISRFLNPGRVLGRITLSQGQGRGGALGVVRLRPDAADSAGLRRALAESLDPGMVAGIISTHLVESDPDLSKPLTAPDEPDPGAGDWYVLVDGTDVSAISGFLESRLGAGPQGTAIVSRSTYTLLWDLAKSDLDRSE